MTDNPLSSGHQNKSGQGAMAGIDCCSNRLSCLHRRGRADSKARTGCRLGWSLPTCVSRSQSNPSSRPNFHAARSC